MLLLTQVDIVGYNKLIRRYRLNDSVQNKQQEVNMTNIIKFIRNEEGVTILEYALIVGLISVAAILLFEPIGLAIKAFFVSINAALT